MVRAAIYTRFSSDRQHGRSIDDQLALCRGFAQAKGWTVTATYADHAVSGSTVHRRPDFARMLGDAHASGFDVLLAEDIDRLARGEGDAPQLRRQLEFLGIEIHTCADGHVTKLHAGLKGLMSSLFLDNLADHTRRGMAGVIRSGRHAGGRAYGYRPVAGKPGVLEIVPAEADVVRRIFERYVLGDTPRRIAHALNADMILPPRGDFWRASTINGNTKRGCGILQNEIYRGVIVWNRVRMVRDPDTGRRVSRPNPASQHQRIDAPELRIVSDELYARARAHKAERAFIAPRLRRKPRRLLSGLLRCGACGGGMSTVSTKGRPRLNCTRSREAGTCDHRRAYYVQDIERRLVHGLRAQLGSRDAIAYFLKCAEAAERLEARTAAKRRGAARRALAIAERDLQRAIDAMIRGTLATAEADRQIPALRAVRDRFQDDAAPAEPPDAVRLHPAALDRYLDDIGRLSDALNEQIADGDMQAADAVRAVIETVTVMPAGAGISPELRVAGRLDALTGRALFAKGSVVPGWPVAGARVGQSRHPAMAFHLIVAA